MVGILLCLIYLFICFGCAGSLLLHRFSSSCGEQGLLSSCSAHASHCDGFSCGALDLGLVLQELWHVGSVDVVPRL